MRMAATPAMGEMRAGVDLTAVGDGHYKGQIEPGMTGSWKAIVRVNRGGQLVARFIQPVTTVE
jgi:hypothetical protein